MGPLREQLPAGHDDPPADHDHHDRAAAGHERGAEQTGDILAEPPIAMAHLSLGAGAACVRTRAPTPATRRRIARPTPRESARRARCPRAGERARVRGPSKRQQEGGPGKAPMLEPPHPVWFFGAAAWPLGRQQPSDALDQSPPQPRRAWRIGSRRHWQHERPAAPSAAPCVGIGVVCAGPASNGLEASAHIGAGPKASASPVARPLPRRRERWLAAPTPPTRRRPQEARSFFGPSARRHQHGARSSEAWGLTSRAWSRNAYDPLCDSSSSCTRLVRPKSTHSSVNIRVVTI